jgi:hypothetical protein
MYHSVDRLDFLLTEFLLFTSWNSGADGLQAPEIIFKLMPFTIPYNSSCGRISYHQQMKNNYTKNL